MKNNFDSTPLPPEAPTLIKQLKWLRYYGWQHKGYVFIATMVLLLFALVPLVGVKRLIPWNKSRVQLGFFQFDNHAGAGKVVLTVRNVSRNTVYLRRLQVSNDLGQREEITVSGTIPPGEERRFQTTDGKHEPHKFQFLHGLTSEEWDHLVDCIHTDPCLIALTFNPRDPENKAMLSTEHDVTTSPASVALYYRLGSSETEESESFVVATAIGNDPDCVAKIDADSEQAKERDGAEPNGSKTSPDKGAGALPASAGAATPSTKAAERRSPAPVRPSSTTVPEHSPAPKAVLPPPSQTMLNSPGGIQAGGDVTISADRRLITSMTLRVSIETETPPSTPSEVRTDAGLQSAMALFTKDKTRIRFVTDFMIHDQQVSETRRRLSFVYTPETPEEVLGKPIEFLSSINNFVVNYSDIFRTKRFDTSHGETRLLYSVLVNGLPVASMSAGVQPPGTLASGQASLDVSNGFTKIPTVYASAVSRR